MKETDLLDEYILQHIDEEGEYLKSLYRDTHVKLLRPRMASGHLQGRMLKMFVRMIRPRQILEIVAIPLFVWPRGLRRAECFTHSRLMMNKKTLPVPGSKTQLMLIKLNFILGMLFG